MCIIHRSCCPLWWFLCHVIVNLCLLPSPRFASRLHVIGQRDVV